MSRTAFDQVRDGSLVPVAGVESDQKEASSASVIDEL
jgi:hypothetical protein